MVNDMKSILPLHPQCALTLFMLAGLALVLLSSGCISQPSQNLYKDQQASGTYIVTAMQPDSTHLIITYHSGPGMDNLIELESTVTDSEGKSITQSSGSRRATTPVQIQGTTKFTGLFGGVDHVVVTGYFSDGKQQVLLNTTV